MQDIRGDLEIYHKKDIAMQYLNLALSEYVKGKNMFAVLHLAGAAEEMLGKIVSLRSNETALEHVHRWMRSWYQITDNDTPQNKELNKHILKIKNGVKHINGAHNLEIEFDINREAKEIIRRAIENFNQIPELKHSEELLEYYRHTKQLHRTKYSLRSHFSGELSGSRIYHF
jgi:hypothetical protein